MWGDPVPDLSPEEELRFIDDIAKKVVSYGMEPYFIVFVGGFGPMTKFTAEVPLLFIAPFLEVLGIPAYKLVALFSKRENAEIIITKIEELNAEKKKEEEKEKVKSRSNKNNQKRWSLPFRKKV